MVHGHANMKYKTSNNISFDHHAYAMKKLISKKRERDPLRGWFESKSSPSNDTKLA